MYARETELPYESEQREEFLSASATSTAKSIATQPGFKLSAVLGSREGGQAKARMISVWNTPEDFERFSQGDHLPLSEEVRETESSRSAGSEYDVLSWVTPQPGEVRLVHLQFDAAEYEGGLAYWREEGQALVSRQPGNMGAWAVCNPEGLDMTLIFAWREPEDGETFLYSEDHVKAFAPGLGTNVSLISLRRLKLV